MRLGDANMLNRHTTANYVWALREIVQRSNSRLLKKIYKWRYSHILVYLGSYLPLSAQFAEKPEFPHGISGIFISQGARIGKNCTIFQQVTIGSNTLSDSKTFGSPTIGDNVYIGCGAKIIGGVKVGNNVRIGANCVVVTDIPDNATVVLSAPRVIVHEENRNNVFVKYNTEGR